MPRGSGHKARQSIMPTSTKTVAEPFGVRGYEKERFQDYLQGRHHRVLINHAG